MSNMPTFPAFIRLEHQPNGSAKQSFLAEVSALAGDVQRKFDAAYDEVGKSLSRSITSLRSSKIGFDIDVSGLRQAAAEADHTVLRLNVLKDAAIKLAASTGDTSSQTKLYIDALRAQVTEAERAKDMADAQVTTYSRLQSQIDQNIAGNRELADSYRALYAEQARAENASFASQQMFNKLAAPGLTQQPKSAAESASVFENQSYAPKADTSSALDRFLSGSASLDRAAVSATTLEQVLGRVAKKGADVTAAMEAAARASNRAAEAVAKVPSSTPVNGKWGVEAMLAGQATLDRAAVSGITLEQVLGRVAGKGSEVAAALDQAATASARAAEQQARALKLAEAEMERYAAEANRLQQRLDPALAVQQRFDQELEKASRLLQAGAIDAKTYAAAQDLARQELQQGWAAIASSTEQVTNATKRGTTAHQSMINTVGASRQAYTMLGQQMQDVVVQAQLGTNAIIIFTQQVPQAAFALSGLAESSNKTEQKIGQFASFLSGPYGAAVFAAIAIGGPLIANFLGIGEEADKAKPKVYDFSGSFDVLTLKVSQSVDAMEQLAAATKTAIAVQGDFLAQQGAVANASVAALEKQLADIHAKRRELKENPSFASAIPGTEFYSYIKDRYKDSDLAKAQEDTQKALDAAREARTNAEIAQSQQQAIEAVDKRAAIMGQYKRAVGKLNEQYKAAQSDPIGAAQAGTSLDKATYEKRFQQLEKQKEDALDALKKKPKGSNALANFGERSDESIKRIMDKFSEQPKLITEAMAATRELDNMIAKLEKRQPSGWKEMVQDAKDAKAQIEDFFSRQADQIERNSQRTVALQNLNASGHEAEAQALQYIWQLEDKIGTEQQIRAQIQSYINQGRDSEAKALQSLLSAHIEMKQRVIEVAREEQRHLEVLKAKQEMMNLYLDATRSVKSELAAILSGTGSLASLKTTFQQLRGKVMAEQIFGPALRELDKYVKQHSGIDDSVTRLVTANDRTSDSVSSLADAFDAAAGRISGTGSSSAAYSAFQSEFDRAFPRANSSTGGAAGAANDNGSDGILVEGRKTINPDTYITKLSNAIAKSIGSSLDQTFNTTYFGKMSGVVSGGIQGYLTAGPAGGVLGALKEIPGLPKGIGDVLGKGVKGMQTGAAVASLANALGVKMDSTGSSIGGAIGSFIPIPGASIIGSVAGGLLGGLFQPSNRGTVVLNGANYTSVTGSTAAARSGLTSAGGSIQDQLSSIASALEKSVGAFQVSIGQYKDYYRVSASGTDRVGDKYYPNGAGADILYDGTDQATAISIAVKNAIEDGAIAGISAASKRILANSSDVNSAVSKVTAIESIPIKLKQLTDPVGAAIDDLNSQFSTLVGYLKEGSATTEQYAQAQQLYELQRASAIKQATEQVTGSLKNLYDSLTVGNDARSLSERKTAALAAYQPLAKRVAAGDTTAFDDYTTAAQTLLDIQRQFSGSQTDYFTLLDQVTKLTKSTLDTQNARITAATNSTTDNPFSGITTTTTSDNAAVTAALQTLNLDLNSQLSAVNDNLGSVIDALKTLKDAGYSVGTAGSW